MSEPTVEIIPFGGVGQFGMNCTILRAGDDAIVVDAGMAFPAGENWGVDAIVPDLGELLDSGVGVLAVVLTHGHEDHIGGLPYVFQKTSCPVYGSDMTLELARARLRNWGLAASGRLVSVRGRGRVSAGPFQVEFLNVTHSVPGSYALAIDTPAGAIVHSADFKLDPTPVSGPVTDLERLRARGKEGVKILLLDSTNAARGGSVPSERCVGESFSRFLPGIRSRVLVTTFSSHVHRVQQLLDAAIRSGRRAAFVGRRMTQSLGIARETGHLKVASEALVDPQQAMGLPPERCLIIAGGSQGEPASAMCRIARGEHPDIEVGRGDVVIHSARPIPGNEVAIGRMLDGLARKGAFIPSDPDYVFHVSGHAGEADLSAFLDTVRPETLIPVHGTYRHLQACATIAENHPHPPRSVLVAENGDIIRLDRSGARVTGRVNPKLMLVDRDGCSIDEALLRERRVLGTEGVLLPLLVLERSTGKILAAPYVLSRGFALPRDGGDLLRDAARLVSDTVQEKDPSSTMPLEDRIKDEVGRFVRRRTGKRPLVSPIVVQM